MRASKTSTSSCLADVATRAGFLELEVQSESSTIFADPAQPLSW